MNKSQNEQILPAKRFSEQSESGSSSKRARLSQDEKEESNFLRLYWQALNHMRNISGISETDVMQAEDNIVASFRYDKGGRFETIDFNAIENRCGYISRYSANGAGLARSRILKAIDNCDALKSYLNFSEVSVISLGAGPGNDVIGFCSAFHEHALNLASKPQALYLTLVDSIKRWSSCFNIVEFLMREGDFGSVSNLFKEIDITTLYMGVDLTGNPLQNSKYSKALKGADIIIMQKLLSIIPYGMKTSIIKNVAETMKEKALLLFIDSPFHENDFEEHMDVIYSSSAEEYIFSPSEKEFGQNYTKKSKAQITVLMKKQNKVD